jgi:hypothetical protein
MLHVSYRNVCHYWMIFAGRVLTLSSEEVGGCVCVCVCVCVTLQNPELGNEVSDGLEHRVFVPFYSLPSIASSRLLLSLLSPLSSVRPSLPCSSPLLTSSTVAFVGLGSIDIGDIWVLMSNDARRCFVWSG